MQIKPLPWLFKLTTILTLSCLVMPASASEKQAPEGKVAVVNGTIITQGYFDREMNRVQQQFAGRGRSINKSRLPDIQRGVLESLINRELLYQESQDKGTKVGDASVNEELNILKKKFSKKNEFKIALERMNISEAELRIQLRKGMAIQQLIENEIVQHIHVPEKDVKTFYDGHPEMFKEPEQVRARHILIKVGPGSEESKKEAGRKKLEGIRNRLQKGEDFEALAKDNSEGPSASKGGDLGYFRRGQMVKSFEDAAFALDPGKVSDIIETKFGYHLIKVIDKKAGSIMDFEQVSVRLQDYLKQQKIKEALNIYIKKLKDKADVQRYL